MLFDNNNPHAWVEGSVAQGRNSYTFVKIKYVGRHAQPCTRPDVQFGADEVRPMLTPVDDPPIRRAPYARRNAYCSRILMRPLPNAGPTRPEKSVLPGSVGEVFIVFTHRRIARIFFFFF